MRVSGIPCIFVAAVAIATAGGGASAASPFCDGVKAAVAAADNDFVSMQVTTDRSGARVHKARIVLPRAGDCVVLDGDDYVSYTCIFEYPTPAERQTQAANLSSEIAACLGVAAKPPKARDGLFTFDLPYALVVGSKRDSGPPANTYGVRLEVIPWGH